MKHFAIDVLLLSGIVRAGKPFQQDLGSVASIANATEQSNVHHVGNNLRSLETPSNSLVRPVRVSLRGKEALVRRDQKGSEAKLKPHHLRSEVIPKGQNPRSEGDSRHAPPVLEQRRQLKDYPMKGGHRGGGGPPRHHRGRPPTRYRAPPRPRHGPPRTPMYRPGSAIARGAPRYGPRRGPQRHPPRRMPPPGPRGPPGRHIARRPPPPRPASRPIRGGHQRMPPGPRGPPGRHIAPGRRHYRTPPKTRHPPRPPPPRDRHIRTQQRHGAGTPKGGRRHYRTPPKTRHPRRPSPPHDRHTRTQQKQHRGTPKGGPRYKTISRARSQRGTPKGGPRYKTISRARSQDRSVQQPSGGTNTGDRPSALQEASAKMTSGPDDPIVDDGHPSDSGPDDEIVDDGHPSYSGPDDPIVDDGHPRHSKRSDRDSYYQPDYDYSGSHYPSWHSPGPTYQGGYNDRTSHGYNPRHSWSPAGLSPSYYPTRDDRGYIREGQGQREGFRDQSWGTSPNDEGYQRGSWGRPNDGGYRRGSWGRQGGGPVILVSPGPYDGRYGYEPDYRTQPPYEESDESDDYKRSPATTTDEEKCGEVSVLLEALNGDTRDCLEALTRDIQAELKVGVNHVKDCDDNPDTVLCIEVATDVYEDECADFANDSKTYLGDELPESCKVTRRFKTIRRRRRRRSRKEFLASLTKPSEDEEEDSNESSESSDDASSEESDSPGNPSIEDGQKTL